MSKSMTPRVFVSAGSSDLRSARKVVNDALTRIECLPIEESVFGTEYGPIREMIARKIDSCQAVIHLVGRDYGGEPDPRTLPAGQPRRSWTQLEYDLAKEQKQKQKLYLLVCDDAFPFDPLAFPESTDMSALQIAHRQAVLADQHLWHSVRTLDELQRQIETLKVPLDVVRAELRRQQTRYRLASGLVASAIVLVLVGVICGVSQLGKKVEQTVGQVVVVGKDVQHVEQKVDELPAKVEEAQQETVRQLTDPAALAETIRKQIQAASEAKIQALPDEKGSWRLVAEVEKERDLALGRVEDLIKLIQEGLKEGARPVFQRATEILQKEGTDEALAYLESSRPSTLELARRHAEQANVAQARAESEKEQRNKALQPLVLEAGLLESKLQWKPALQLREQVAELAPDWIHARNFVGMLHLKLARFPAAEPHLRAVVKLVATAGDEAIALNNLAHLLKATNRLAEAELLYRRAQAYDEQFYGADHPKVATVLRNLAELLLATNRPVEAEPLMRRALAIDDLSYRAEHPSVAADLDDLAQLLLATNRLVEAEPLMRRALAIDEQTSGAEHLEVAIRLNNLAQLLKATDRFAVAEPLMRRALAINAQTYGADHPSVATNLSNLAQLLLATNRLVEAEPLMRRALAIDEKTYGADHPSVAISLNNLAGLLQSTNRPADAEPLMRRMLAIFHRFRVKTGHTHPHMIAAVGNYLNLPRPTNLSTVEIAQQVTDATATIGPLKPISPEVDRLLGPAQPVAEVLARLDRQYKVDGKPAVYFLAHDQPLAPHLDELLQPNPDSLNAAGDTAFRNGDHAYAIVNYEESLKMLANYPDKAATTLMTRMNRAAALRELGEVQQARDELRRLLSGLREGDTISAFTKGRARYHQALCEWRLGDRDAAQREAEESLKAYGDDESAAPQKKQTEQLLAHFKEIADLKEYEPLRPLTVELKENELFPPLKKGDAVMALKQARVRFRARADLATLPLNQSAVPLLDQMLGPAKSTKEVFETLDRQYREQKKSEFWFLPLSQPIAPHLDQLLGPLPVP